jgi:hypothetical protein
MKQRVPSRSRVPSRVAGDPFPPYVKTDPHHQQRIDRSALMREIVVSRPNLAVPTRARAVAINPVPIFLSRPVLQWMCTESGMIDHHHPFTLGAQSIQSRPTGHILRPISARRGQNFRHRRGSFPPARPADEPSSPATCQARAATHVRRKSLSPLSHKNPVRPRSVFYYRRHGIVRSPERGGTPSATRRKPPPSQPKPYRDDRNV